MAAPKIARSNAPYAKLGWRLTHSNGHQAMVKLHVFDRAYSDINFWLKITQADSHFVTRLKDHNIALLKEGKKAEAKKKIGVLYDGIYKPHPQSLINAGVPKEL